MYEFDTKRRVAATMAQATGGQAPVQPPQDAPEAPVRFDDWAAI